MISCTTSKHFGPALRATRATIVKTSSTFNSPKLGGIKCYNTMRNNGNSYTYNSYFDQRIILRQEAIKKIESSDIKSFIKNAIINANYKQITVVLVAAALSSSLLIYLYKGAVQNNILKINRLNNEFNAPDAVNIGELNKSFTYTKPTNIDSPSKAILTTQATTQFLVAIGPPGTGKSLYVDHRLQSLLFQFKDEDRNFGFKQVEPWFVV